MTEQIPDSWELPSYLAGDLYDLDLHRSLRDYRDGPREMHEGPGSVVPFPRKKQPEPDPSSDWTEAVQRMRENPIEPYDPSDHPDRDFYEAGDLQHLHDHGFFQVEPGVWHRHVTDAQGQPMAAMHILTYDPGHRRPTTGELAPWVLTTDPESAGLAFGSLRGHSGAMAAANADRDAIRRLGKVAGLRYDFGDEIGDRGWEAPSGD